MGEPSLSPIAAEPVEPDRPGPLMELIQLYRVEHAMLIAHQREVERRRAAVRTAAEREASEILLDARREIRRVLVRTRQELAALTAQVRAAGCEPPGQSGPPIVSDDFQVSAARDVRDVLRDARSELADLSKEAVNLWPSAEEPRLLAPAAVIEPAPEPATASDVSLPSTLEQSGGAADGPSEPEPASSPAEQFVVVRWRSAQAPTTSLSEKLIEHWRIAAVALAILVVIAVAMMALRPSSSTDAADTTLEPGTAASTAQGATTPAPAIEAPAQSAAPAATTSTAGIDASKGSATQTLSLTLEIRRPVWLRVNADGGEDTGRTYQQGERRTIQAAREIVLRAGDAGAVLVSLGGGAQVPFGPDGQVRTRRFERETAAATAQALTPTRSSEMPPQAQGGSGLAATGSEQESTPSATAGLAGRTSIAEPQEPAAPTPDDAVAEREILERHQRWFDAFHRGDRATMASLAAENFSLLDQRPDRTTVAPDRVGFIHDLRVQVTAGIGAVVSGRITETSTPEEAPTVSMFSEVWIRQGEEWQLVSVRLVPVNTVPSTLQ